MEEELTVPSLLRTSGRWLARALAVAIPAVAVGTVAGTVIGVKTLTDAPTPIVPKATLRLRFFDAERGEPRGFVHVSGDQAGVDGRWGVRLEDAYVQIHRPTNQYLLDGQEVVVRPYVVLDGTAPTPSLQKDRRGVMPDKRRQADKRAQAGKRGQGDRRESRADRRGGDRRRRDRRKQDLPQPWPVSGALSGYAWPDDPVVLASNCLSTWQVDNVASPAGPLPAWRFTPRRRSKGADTWVIGVHGRGARRAELFRIASTALEAGATCSVISYRSDSWTDAPAPLVTLGDTEWEDLESAVRMAMAHGAERIVLAGCSMGGGIVATFLRRSDFATHITGVILDAPALDWGPILDHVAKTRRIPSLFVPLVMTFGKMRSRLDFDALNHVKSAGEFTHPILLYHGDEDDVVPIWTSDAFAAARPDLVTYVRVDGAAHVRAWNHAPDRYDRAMEAFLNQIATQHAVPPGRRRLLRLPHRG